MGFQNMIVLSDPKLIKEFYNNPLTSGRSLDNPLTYEYTKGDYGILNSEGQNSEAQRRFTLKTLKDFGYAKSVMEKRMMEDVCGVLKWLKQTQGSPIFANRIFNTPVGNTLWNMVSGQRCDWESEKSPFVEHAEELVKCLSQVTGNGLYYAPFLRHVFPESMGWNRWVKATKELRNVTENCVQEHESAFDGTDLRDYVDHYLNEIKKTQDPESFFYKEKGHKNLVAAVIDLFLGGSETTATTLAWGLLYISHHHEVQKKVHEEIDRVIGRSALPVLSDKPKMPYVSAVLSEILRMSTVIPLGLPHRVLSDFEFHGYTIRKDTIVFANLHKIHYDPEIWDDADIFRPERFLSEDGSSFVRNESLISFSEGKRKCPGETFAKDSLFLYFTSVFQSFLVLPDPEDKTWTGYVPDIEPEADGFVLATKPFKVIMNQR